MKKTILIILLYLLTNTLFAQVNLVPNGDFEIYSNLPTMWDQVNLVVGWNNVNGVYNPLGITGSPDYSNILSFSVPGSIIPYSGNGQIGLITYVSNYIWREYISTQFITPMIPGHNYKVSFYLTNGKDTIATKCSNNFGIRFSNNPLYQDSCEPIHVIPQIEIDTIIYFWNYWQHYSFKYTADSSYKIITIGNFRDDAHTLISNFGKWGTYYFIDKIELFPFLTITGDSTICASNFTELKIIGDSIVKWAESLNPGIIIATDSLITVAPTITTTYLAYGALDTASFTVHVVNPPIINLGNDTSLCQGQILTLNATSPNTTYKWQDNTINATYNVSNPGIYWVKVTNQYNCYNSDTINITYKDCDTSNIIIPNIFTPNGDGYNDYFVIKNAEYKNIDLQVFNRWGVIVYKDNNYQNNWEGKYKGNPLTNGVYYYIINAKGKYNDIEKQYHGSLTILR